MLIQVKVQTRASENRVIGLEGDILKVKCTAVPDQGKANEIVVALLSKYFNVPKSHIKIMRGKTSPTKIIEIMERNLL